MEDYALYLLVGVFIVGVFAWELFSIWWRETQWRRKRNKRTDDSWFPGRHPED